VAQLPEVELDILVELEVEIEVVVAAADSAADFSAADDCTPHKYQSEASPLRVVVAVLALFAAGAGIVVAVAAGAGTYRVLVSPPGGIFEQAAVVLPFHGHCRCCCYMSSTTTETTVATMPMKTVAA